MTCFLDVGSVTGAVEGHAVWANTCVSSTPTACTGHRAEYLCIVETATYSTVIFGLQYSNLRISHLSKKLVLNELVLILLQ